MAAKTRSLVPAPSHSASAIGAAANSLAADGEQNKAVACTPHVMAIKVTSSPENTPSLASQPDQFLQWQLVFFASASRKSGIKGPIAEQLSNEDVRDLGAYFASLKASDLMTAKGPDDHPYLTEAGKKAAVAGRCASCHGDNYVGQQSRRPFRWATRGLPCEGASRLQIRRPVRRRCRCDGRGRLSPKPPGYRGPGALPLAALMK